MANTKDLQEVIDDIHKRNRNVEYDGESEKAYHDRMMKLYDTYIDESDEITRKYKIRTFIFLGLLFTTYIAFFIWRSMT